MITKGMIVLKYNGIIISDIHFGATDPSQLKTELTNIFIKYLLEMKKIDFIIINGDYFDHKLYLNDKVSDYAISFMNTLVKISQIHSCPIRIVYGTESHEVNQYTVFSDYENNPEIDFKIIRRVSDEELLQNMSVLYIPEEYVLSKKEYYGKYLNGNKKYDYIFGHGVIQEVMTEACRNSDNEKKSERKRVPTFKSKELENICNGQVYFGHYHINTNMNDKVFYVGSYSRWIHGESEPKGFYHVKFDPDKKRCTQTFIENYLAKKYITYTYAYDSKVLESEDELLKELNKRDKLTESSDVDNVRYIFNIPENHPNPEFIINILNERYKFKNNIKFKVVNGYVEKKKKVNKERLNEVMNDYPFIFDKSQKLEDKIVYFIKKRYEYDISPDHVIDILYDEKKEEA